jgi:DNA mismatch endonuclease (patch repair protein)
MADVFSKRKRSEVMSRIRSRGNKATELVMARLLRAAGIRGWRRHFQVRIVERGVRKGIMKRIAECRMRNNSKLRAAVFPLRIPHSELRTFAVRPDFVFLKSRTALFVDGCFWHGCPRHGTRPKNNRAFWHRKLSANEARDRLVNRALRRAGWQVLRIWEHDLPERKAEGRRPATKLHGSCAGFKGRYAHPYPGCATGNQI